MKRKPFLITLSLILILMGGSPSAVLPTSTEGDIHSTLPTTPQACTSFCLDNGDHCLFGTNQENVIDAGLLFVNKRHVLKTGWDPSTSGEYARWISQYGSMTFVHAGYQLAWAGMNEAGLMISTMALAETQNPAPDERPPLASAFWAQYQLDNFSTVEEVIASDSLVRIADTVDHYLVCDRTGSCATIEFLEGDMVVHTGASLPLKALTNSTYQQSVSTWQEGNFVWGVTVHDLDPAGPLARAGVQVGDLIVALDGVQLNRNQPVTELFSELLSQHEVGDEMQLTIRRPQDDRTVTVAATLDSRTTEQGQVVPSLGGLALSAETSLARFVTTADRLEAFEPTSSEQAVAYAFDTLQSAAGDAAWSIVFDPTTLRVYFRTNRNQQIRFVDLPTLDFSCHTPVMMMDVHADVSGDISSDLVEYSHEVSLDHTLSFIEQYERLDLPPLLVDVLLGGLESFPCKEDEAAAVEEMALLLEGSEPLLPPRASWVLLAAWRRLGPIWLPLTALSLAFVSWRLAQDGPTSWGRRLFWGLIVVILGPFGLLAYLLSYRKRRRAPKVKDATG